MADRLQCPQCAAPIIDVRDYESMIVVSRGHALFTMRCPACSARVSTLAAIPSELLADVETAALEVGAGMGRE